MKKFFIITGANRGLGKAFYDQLIEDKNNFVISISRSLSDTQKERDNENFHFLNLDLSQKDQLKKIKILKDLISGNEVYFLNNASVINPIDKIENLSDESIENLITVNIFSTIRIVKFLIKHHANKNLTFVNISSGAATKAIDSWSLYCSSKAFVKMFFEVAEIENTNHKFFNIDPGVINTDMQSKIRSSDFPDVSNFKDLYREGKLKNPEQAAIDILNLIK